MDPASLRAGEYSLRISTNEAIMELSAVDSTINFAITNKNDEEIEEPVFEVVSVNAGADGGKWTTIMPAGTPPLIDGEYVVHATLTDMVGNIIDTQMTNTPIAVFSVDAIEPAVDSFSLQVNGTDDRFVKLGDSITLTFTSTETLNSEPEVYLGTVPMARVSNDSEDTFTYAYTPELDNDGEEDGLIDGIYIVSVRLTDKAGNVVDNLEDDALTFDVVPPSIVDTNVYPLTANRESELTYQVYVTEPVSSIALSATHFSQNETIVFPNVMSTGNVYTFSLENGSNVLQLAPEGIYLPTIELVDLAGNSKHIPWMRRTQKRSCAPLN